jgi:hypothetical protein
MKTRLALRFGPRRPVRPLKRLQRWLSQHLVQSVPEEISICEYECQEPECHIAKWALCEKRVARTESAFVRID